MKKLVDGYLRIDDNTNLETELEILLCEACARLQAKLTSKPKDKKKLKNYVRVKIRLSCETGETTIGT